MECIACGHDKTTVNRTNEILTSSRTIVTRERRCPNCSLTFTTEEVIRQFKVLNPETIESEWFELDKIDEYRDVILGNKPHPKARCED